MKPESVLCPNCGNEWKIPLLALVRRRWPLWCPVCVRKADDRLIEAMQRHPEKGVANRQRDSEETPSGGH